MLGTVTGAASAYYLLILTLTPLSPSPESFLTSDSFLAICKMTDLCTHSFVSPSVECPLFFFLKKNYVPMYTCALEAKTLAPPELEFWAFASRLVWDLGTEFQSSERTGSPFICCSSIATLPCLGHSVPYTKADTLFLWGQLPIPRP